MKVANYLFRKNNLKEKKEELTFIYSTLLKHLIFN